MPGARRQRTGANRLQLVYGGRLLVRYGTDDHRVVTFPLRADDRVGFGGESWRCVSLATGPREPDGDPFAPATVVVEAILECVVYMHA